MNKLYDIYCIVKGGQQATKMASIESNGASRAEIAGRNLALTLGMHFHHIKPADERSESPVNFNKPKPKNEI